MQIAFKNIGERGRPVCIFLKTKAQNIMSMEKKK